MFSRRAFIVTSGSAFMGLKPDKRMRIALVGTGVRGTDMWGRGLKRDYSDVVEFVGLCDINPGRLSYGKNYIGVNCPTFTNFDEMLLKTKPDRVVVTTTDSTHDQQIVAAMKFGADVITEKPLTTDESKLQSILDTQKQTGRDLVVAHNYRYAPYRARIKQLLMEKRIGKLTSVDLNYYLDVHHGADYFRRWHGKERYSGGLFIHKSCHHFDLLNWWIGSEPETVYAQGALEHYGHNNSFRSSKCRGCSHQKDCQYYWDITGGKGFLDSQNRLVNLYVENEEYDGYIRDGCVWSKEIDIFDKMTASIGYTNGVQVSYSLTTYSPYEGYRVAFNGTQGRLEAWLRHRQPWPMENYDEIRVTDNFGETNLIKVPIASGGHGGGDKLMLDHIFRDLDGPDPFEQRAGLRDGAMSVLLGIGARNSAKTGTPVRIGDLTSLKPGVL